jgi:hypothetical protein
MSKAESAIIVIVFIFGLIFGCGACEGQIIPEAAVKTEIVEASLTEKTFHRSVIKAALVSAERNEISRLDVLRIRMAMLSPAFRKHAEDLAVLQMYFHDGNIPLNVDGTVNRSSIDWSKLMEYLIKLLPLFLEILKLLG